MKNKVRLPFLEERVCLWTKAAITGRILDSFDFSHPAKSPLKQVISASLTFLNFKQYLF